MPVRRLLLVATLLALTACGAPPPRAAPPAAPDRQNPLKPIAPGEPATPFRVETTEGRILDSAELIGRRPFVVVFFASWCGVCDLDLPVVHRAVADAGAEVAIFGVALDDTDTWPAVADFARREGMHYPIVHGARFMRFVGSYDPTGRIPLVAVVGRDGTLIDVLIGYSATFPERLADDLARARRAAVDESDR